MKYLFYISIVLIFFSSCEKDANIKLPEQEPKLSVSCFISPGDTTVKASVFLSEPVFSTSTTNAGVVNNAIVTLSNGINTISLVYNMNTGLYSAQLTFPILYNATYYLSVIDAQGRHVTSSTTTPSATNPSYDISRTSTADPNGNINYQIKCKIHDIPGEENYYRAHTSVIYYDVSQGDTVISMQRFSVYVNDRSGDGKDLDANMELFSSSSGMTDTTAYMAHRIMVIKANRDYYNFHNSVTTANFSNNPFAEPTMVYSNIQGGFGCFGAYTLTYKDLEY